MQGMSHTCQNRAAHRLLRQKTRQSEQAFNYRPIATDAVSRDSRPGGRFHRQRNTEVSFSPIIHARDVRCLQKPRDSPLAATENASVGTGLLSNFKLVTAWRALSLSFVQKAFAYKRSAGIPWSGLIGSEQGLDFPILH